MKYNVENAEYLDAPNGKRYRIATSVVGNDFGQVAVLVAKNGRPVAIGDNVYPFGEGFMPPMSEYEEMAAKL